MTDDLLIWCRDDSPHGEHWRQNAFNDRDYCSGRPAPKPEPADLLDEATRLADEGAYDTADTLRALVERVQRLSNGTQEMTRQTQRILAERDEARGKLDKVRTAVTSVTGEPHDDVSRDVLAILDGKTGD